jgi:16S rRNA (cytosine1402-N4)-methyltransferase
MMAGRGDESPLAAGGPVRHVPVLLAEVAAALALRENGLYLDATFGAGGYSREILATAGTRVLALDRDPTAVAGGAELVERVKGRLQLVQARFSELDRVAERLGLSGFDGVVLDIGVSSMQIDDAARGFSFRFDGPLDMRMEGTGRSAADLLETGSEAALADILYHFGEERMARRIARAIVADRKTKPFTSTRELAALVARLVPHKPTDIHPATRTFQALRIAVNDELGELSRALAAAERVLKPGGRLAVVSFHSLEDRIVKQFLAERSLRGHARSRLLPGEPHPPEPTFALVGRPPIMAGAAETARNPRARSARLRIAERTDAPARSAKPDSETPATLPGPGRRRSR